MKRTIALILALIVMVVVAGCGQPGSSDNPGQAGGSSIIGATGASPDDYFLWEGDRITGLTDKGAAASAIVIPARATEITQSAFAYGVASALKSISFQNPDIRLGIHCFDGCTSLAAVELPTNLQVVPAGTFASCTALKSITIPDSVTLIEGNAFSSSGLETVKLPESLTRIESFAFSHCTGLMQVEIPSNTEVIEERAFFNCESLSSVTLPDSLKEIGTSAFGQCDSLKSVKIPGSVEVFGGSCFDTPGARIVVTVKEGSVADEKFYGYVAGAEATKVYE